MENLRTEVHGRRSRNQRVQGRLLHAQPRPATRREKRLLVLIAIVAALGLVAGWRLFYFLTDDAYIAFRYVSNSLLGHGYVWNPPPFRPVEGYTSFLWIVLLDGVWRSTGVEPPTSSNILALILSAGALWVAARMTWRTPWRDELRGQRPLLLALALAGILANRTFLAWTSSGMETALFNLLVLLWIHLGFFLSSGRPRRLLALSLAASGISLTRPDGLLFVVSSLVIVATAIAFGDRARRASRLAASLPLLTVPAHLLWRRSFYGEWLPNTYYAKTPAPWMESGLRYALSFVLEHALWIWLAVLVWVCVTDGPGWLRALARLPELGRGGEESRALLITPLARACVLMTVCAQLGFYTLFVGGDHFEYRVYSYTVPLVFVSFVWLLNQLGRRSNVVIMTLLVFILCSLPIPWTHWVHSRNLVGRTETFRMRVRVADHLPGVIAWYARPFDRLQAWLIDRSVCMRHQEHKAFLAFLTERYPSREYDLPAPDSKNPVFVQASVGYAGWVMPTVHVIDYRGLNDYVIARTPIDPARRRDETNPLGLRQMAHERRPPPGYVECFDRNIRVRNREIEYRQRDTPLTDEDIRRCEREWAARVRGTARSAGTPGD